MATTIWNRTMKAVEMTDRPLLGRPVDRTEWSAVALFKGTPPTNAQWSAGCNFDVKVDAGATGEVRLRTFDDAGNEFITVEYVATASIDAVTTGWIRFHLDSVPPVQQYQVLEVRRTVGPGAIMISRASSVFLSSPDEGPGPHVP